MSPLAGAGQFQPLGCFLQAPSCPRLCWREGLTAHRDCDGSTAGEALQRFIFSQ